MQLVLLHRNMSWRNNSSSRQKSTCAPAASSPTAAPPPPPPPPSPTRTALGYFWWLRSLLFCDQNICGSSPNSGGGAGGGGGLSRSAGDACEPLAQRYGEFLKALEGDEEVRGGGVTLALLPPSLSLPLSVCVSVEVEACVFELCASSRAKPAASGASRTTFSASGS